MTLYTITIAVSVYADNPTAAVEAVTQLAETLRRSPDVARVVQDAIVTEEDAE